MKSLPPHNPLVLLILDGWGYRAEKAHNAIAAARTPTWDRLWEQCPHVLLDGSGLSVGLPEGQMGNSEVGHLHMGAGRLLQQDLTRINQAIADQSFFQNPVLLQAFDEAAQMHTAVHLMGLLSRGGVHSHQDHWVALAKLAAERGVQKLYLHPFLDGRDTPPQSAAEDIHAIELQLASLPCGKIVSLIGRYYAMDRDKRWSRTQAAYALLVEGEAKFQAPSAIAALEMGYERNETDEFLQATVIGGPGEDPIKLNDGDVVVFANFRSDRARQLTHALIDTEFHEFERHRWPCLSHCITLTRYADDLPTEVVFPPISLNNILGEYIAELGYPQLRIAETEKYAHVTFFFNGGEEKPFAQEERILIPSPKVATYDLMPEMSAAGVTDALVAAIASQKFALIICNYANPDMVGHTGDFAATVIAIETIDQCLQRIVDALKIAGGEMLITADHGNAECLFDPTTGQAHTAHTTNCVPAIYVGRAAHPAVLSGNLSDIAPTLLNLMGLPIPPEMTGTALFELNSSQDE